MTRRLLEKRLEAGTALSLPSQRRKRRHADHIVIDDQGGLGQSYGECVFVADAIRKD